jgi:hypothetical protein
MPKSRRRRNRRKRKARSRPARNPYEGRFSEPREIVRVPENLNRDELAEEARRRIKEGLDGLRASMAPYDAFDVVANLAFANEPFDAETYRQTEHPGLGAIVELGALLMLERPSREGEGERPHFIQGPVVEEWNEKLRRILHDNLVLTWTELAEDDAEGLNGLRYAIRNYELFVRYPSYESQERHLLSELFPESLDQASRDALGFTIAEGIRCVEELNALPKDRFIDRAQEGKSTHLRLMDARERLRKGQSVARSLKASAEALTKMSRKQAEAELRNMVGGWVFLAMGDTCQVTVAELSQAAGISEDAAEAFLDAFSLSFRREAKDNYTTSLREIRDSPILTDGNGNYLCASTGDLFYSLRPRMEQAFKESNRIWNIYERGRAKFLETESVWFLRQILKPDVWHGNLFYKVNGGEFELDGILIVDTVAFLVEAKAARLTDPARRGAPVRLKRDLEKIVGDAGEQLARVRTLVTDEGRIEGRLADGTATEVDCGRVRRVFSINVVLEDMNWIAPTLWEVLASGIIPSDEELPVVLSIGELEIICELSERCAQLVHYFVRRDRINRVRRVVAPEELDLFMYYLKKGLYFDDVFEEEDSPTMIEIPAMTDDLDAYYFWKQGARRKARKPKQKLTPQLDRILGYLDETRPPGFVEASILILNWGSEERKKFVSSLGRLGRMTAKDGDVHNMTMVSCSPPSSGITGYIVPQKQVRELEPRVLEYCMAKKHQARTDIWVGLGLIEGSPDPFNYFYFDDGRWAPDTELDALLERLHLAPMTPCTEIETTPGSPFIRRKDEL